MICGDQVYDSLRCLQLSKAEKAFSACCCGEYTYKLVRNKTKVTLVLIHVPQITVIVPMGDVYIIDLIIISYFCLCATSMAQTRSSPL